MPFLVNRCLAYNYDLTSIYILGLFGTLFRTKKDQANTLNDRFIYWTHTKFIMIEEFKKFKGQLILNYFLLHPDSETTIKELSRTLKISSATSKHYLGAFAKDNILSVKKTNTAHFYKLNDSQYTRLLKKCFILSYFYSLPISKLTKNTVYLFGSCSNGTYNSKSDIDLGIISTKDDIDYKVLKKIELDLNMPVQLVIIPFYKIKEFEKNSPAIISEIYNGIKILED